MFVIMDEYNRRNIGRIFRTDPENKIHKLLTFAGRDDDVDDPWYSRRFDVAWNDIYEGCTALLASLTKD